MLNADVYETMIEGNEAWFIWADGCAEYLGKVNTQVAMTN